MRDTNQSNDVDPDETIDEGTDGQRSGVTEGGADSDGAIPTRRRSLLQAFAVVPFTAPFSQGRRPPSSGPSRGPPDGNGTGPPDGGERGPSRSGGDLGVGDTRPFSVVASLPERYAMTVETTGDVETTVTGRVDGSDQYVRTTFPGGWTESYFVDGTLYVVTEEGCLEYVDVAAADGRGGDRAPTPRPDPAVEVTAVTTVGDRETLVCALDEWPQPLPQPAREARREHAEGVGVERQRSLPEVTYYVDAEARYLRRIETADATVDYTDWDDVEPVTVPDVPCGEGEQPQA